MPATEKIGSRLKYLRNRSKKTQEDVAKSLEISRAAYSHFENDRNEPDNHTLSKLADFYEVTTDYLLGRKTNLDDVSVAAHYTKDYDKFTPEEQQEIDDYIEFKKAQFKKRHENENKD